MRLSVRLPKVEPLHIEPSKAGENILFITEDLTLQKLNQD